MKKQKPDAVRMLAQFFIDAYKHALQELKSAAAALLDAGVQDMRRLYIPKWDCFVGESRLHRVSHRNTVRIGKG